MNLVVISAERKEEENVVISACIITEGKKKYRNCSIRDMNWWLE
jgi:hypothetical protein